MDSLFSRIDSCNTSDNKNDDFEFSYSTVESYNDNSPQRKKTQWGKLCDKFLIPDRNRGTLSFAEYHALDANNPAEKAKRNLHQRDCSSLTANGLLSLI